jgi:ATPase subunit of ABC transporter with duplicated ATPase domains
MPYSKARDGLAEHDIAAQQTREQEEKTINRLKASAHRLAVWGKVYDNEKLAKKAKTIEKRITRLKDEQTFVSRGSGLNLTIDVGSAQANRMLHIEHQDIAAPDGKPLFSIEDLMIRPGERVALLGHNGVGKTTLINLIMNEYRHNKDGVVVKFNPQCDIGYYDQELQLLNPDLGLMETLRANCSGPDSGHKASLIKAGFPFKDLDKKVGVLSGGEKARIMFLIIKLNQPNFLILDEPTNHIDIQGKEELEEQILETNATILITSHDRRFVDNIAERFVLISDGQLKEINHAEPFYRSSPTEEQNCKQEHTSEDHLQLDDEEQILARIVELESLLESDLARKRRFQKPKLQEAWRKELDQLNSKI